MTDKEKAKAYDEALERAKKQRADYQKELDKTDNNSQLAGPLRAGISAIDMALPELAESEDERIRKWIFDLVNNMNFENLTASEGAKNEKWKKKVLAYIDRQKENPEEPKIAFGDWGDKEKKEAIITCLQYMRFIKKITNQEYDDLMNWLDNNLVYNALKKKQKEHQKKSDAQEKALGRDLTFPQDKDKNLDEIAQDYVDRVKEYNPDPTWNLMQTAVCYGYHCCEQKEQKQVPFSCGHENGTPAECKATINGESIQTENQSVDIPLAEWSEEDKDAISGAIGILLDDNNPTFVFPEYSKLSVGEIVKRLKSFPERFNLEPKKDWSDEDERMLSRCIKSVECSKQFADSETYKAAKDTEIKWLKDLSLGLKKRNEAAEKLCSNEWSKEDEEALDMCLDAIPKRWKTESGVLLTKWLKDNIHPQPKQEWSEEDEKVYTFVYNFFENYWWNKNWDISREQVLKMLKSLRLQPKAGLTRLDESIINAAIAFVEQNDHFNHWVGIDKHTVITALRSLKSSWKPSEEQMHVLKQVEDRVAMKSGYWEQVLDSLYTDLQKL